MLCSSKSQLVGRSVGPPLTRWSRYIDNQSTAASNEMNWTREDLIASVTAIDWPTLRFRRRLPTQDVSVTDARGLVYLARVSFGKTIPYFRG